MKIEVFFSCTCLEQNSTHQYSFNCTLEISHCQCDHVHVCSYALCTLSFTILTTCVARAPAASRWLFDVTSCGCVAQERVRAAGGRGVPGLLRLQRAEPGGGGARLPAAHHAGRRDAGARARARPLQPPLPAVQSGSVQLRR